MPMTAKILLIEGKRNDGPSFVAGLTKKGFQVETFASGSAALTRLQESRPDLVVVNAATMRTSGKRICMSLRQEAPSLPIVLILDEKAEPAEKTDANVVLFLPFTLQKLLNRIKPLMPVEQRSVMRAGPISLDVDQRWVRCGGRQSSLTPRLVILLKILMEQRGMVIEREKLFSLVWTQIIPATHARWMCMFPGCARPWKTIHATRAISRRCAGWATGWMWTNRRRLARCRAERQL